MIKSMQNDNIESIEKFFNTNFGLNVFYLENIRTKKMNMMVKADSYQKKLMDNIFGLREINNNEEIPKKIVEVAIATNKTDNIEKNKQKIVTTEQKGEPSLKISNYSNKNVNIEIKNGNILDEKVNVIVNAANIQLQLGGMFLSLFSNL
jgi:hypothetical protein